MHSAILRALVFLAPAAVIGAATHANVMHAGGYSSEGAPLAIAIAALLTIGNDEAAKLRVERAEKARNNPPPYDDDEISR